MTSPQPTPSVLWMTPLLAGGGYSSEAIAFAVGANTAGVSQFALRQFAVLALTSEPRACTL